MKPQILFFVFALFTQLFTYGKEPTTLNLSNNGTINWVYYDLRNEQSVHPLNGFYLHGNGEVKYLRLNIDGNEFLIDQFGVPLYGIQSRYSIDWNSDNKISRFKDGYTTIARFQYDYSGRLVKIKDGNYNVLFALSYDYNGRLDRLDKGGYNYLLRFYYNYNNELNAIKDDCYDYIWRIDYNQKRGLARIRNDNYNDVAKVNYHNYSISNILKYRTQTFYQIGNQYIDYLRGPYAVQQWQPNKRRYESGISFYEHACFTGNKTVYSLGNYPQIPESWNDSMSSISEGVTVTVYEKENFNGKSMRLSSN